MEYKILKQLCTVTKGQTGIQKAVPGEYPLVVTSEERKSHNEFQFDANAVIVPLVSGTGHGHASIKRIHYQEGKFALGSILCAIIPKDESEINPHFLYYYLNLVKEKELVGRMKGMANVTLPIKEIEKILIPVLTIEEQLKFVDFYTNLKKDSNYITTELNHQIDLINELRQALLQEAMQGKLVSNETSDGKTGADLLQEIQNEKEKLIKEKKIKNSKPSSPISEGEIPFKIPENWTWCRFGEICNYGTSPKIEPDKISEDVWSLDLEDIEKVTSKLIAKVRFKDRKSTSTKSVFKKGQVLYSKLRPNLDKVIVADEDGVCTTEIVPIQFFLNLNPYFIRYYLKSSYFINFILGLTKGMKMPRVGTTDVQNSLIPLPPLDIQEKIVLKLNKLMEYCDELELSVEESQSHNEKLLQQVLREALEGKNDVENENLQLVAEESPIYSIQSRINKSCDTGDMAILSGYIIKKLSTQNSNDFGRVKLQKMLHLTEYYCQLSSELNYQKNVAGPYSWELEHLIEPKLKSLRFFEIKKEKFGATSKVTYTPLSASKEIPSLFKNEFKDQAESINHLLNKFQDKTWEFCEMISTMYAVWNNRLIRKELFTDDILKQDFLAWDDKKERFIDQLDHALKWIRTEKVEPVGFGKYIDKK